MGKSTRDNEAVHASRSNDERASQDVHDVWETPWTQPASLEAPPPRAGMVQRWIRVGTMGKDDPMNTSRKFREGWKPRPADSVPPDYPLPTIANGRYAGFIGIEGSILCEMPIERNEARNKFYAAKRDRMTQAINDQLAQSNQRLGGGFHEIKKVEEKSVRVRAVAVQEDE